MKRWAVLGFMIVLAVAFILTASFITTKVFWLFTIMYFVGCYYTLVALFGAFWERNAPGDDPRYRPFVSVLIPMKNERDVIMRTLQDLRDQDYRLHGLSRMEIIVIDDGSTDGCDKVVESAVRRWPNGRNHKVRLVRNPGPDHGKPAGLNFGFKFAKGEIICVFDSDARVPHDFIRNAVPFFRDERVGGVQGKVRIYNRLDTTLTEIQDDEFASFNRAVQRSRDVMGGAVALGGNGQLTRHSALKRVGGWKIGSITEDLELSVRMYDAGYDIRYSERSTVYQEGVRNLKALFRQRTRWSQGHILTFLQMAPLVIRSRKMAPFKKFDLLVYLTGIMTPGFVFLSYFLGILAFFSLVNVSTGVTDLLWIWASIAFLPVIFWGMYKEVSKNPFVLVFKSFRIFLFCFHWIPTFFYGWYRALANGLGNSHPEWDKTKHSGAKIIFELL